MSWWVKCRHCGKPVAWSEGFGQYRTKRGAPCVKDKQHEPRRNAKVDGRD